MTDTPKKTTADKLAEARDAFIEKFQPLGKATPNDLADDPGRSVLIFEHLHVAAKALAKAKTLHRKALAKREAAAREKADKAAAELKALA